MPAAGGSPRRVQPTPRAETLSVIAFVPPLVAVSLPSGPCRCAGDAVVTELSRRRWLYGAAAALDDGWMAARAAGDAVGRAGPVVADPPSVSGSSARCVGRRGAWAGAVGGRSSACDLPG